jgi:3-methyladenine DNA glycosylase/8-oxoguanine DNA glycosylase
MTTKLAYEPNEAIEHLSRADSVMAALIHRVGPITLEVRSMHDPFQTLMRSIAYQQLSGRAAQTIYGRVLDLFEDAKPPNPSQVLEMDYDRLRGAGLSNAKTLAIKDLASKTLDGIVPDIDDLRAMDDEAIVERLTSVRGVGRWTVQMLLIFRLGRPDVLPTQDLGVRKGYTKSYGLSDLVPPGVLEDAGEVWRPFRSVASWYLWRAVDTIN